MGGFRGVAKAVSSGWTAVGRQCPGDANQLERRWGRTDTLVRPDVRPKKGAGGPHPPCANPSDLTYPPLHSPTPTPCPSYGMNYWCRHPTAPC